MIPDKSYRLFLSGKHFLFLNNLPSAKVKEVCFFDLKVNWSNFRFHVLTIYLVNISWSFQRIIDVFRAAWLLDAIFWSGKSPSWSNPIKFLVVLFPTNMFFRWFKFQILSFDQKKCCISTSSLLGWGFEISNKAREFLCSKLNNQFCLLGKRWFFPIIFVEYVFFCLFVGSNFLISIKHQIYWVLAGFELEHHTSANTIKIKRFLYVILVGHFLLS